MRFTSIFVAGAFATMAAAQSKTVSLDPAQKSQADCLDACKAGDVKCQSYCITVPSPDDKNINATTECVAACPKGKGSASDTEKYSVCLQDCIANNYWKSVDGTPRETQAAGSKDSASSKAESAASKATGTASDDDTTATRSASESDATNTDASETSASGTASGSAASSTETGNAATALVGGVSLFGLVAAVFAL